MITAGKDCEGAPRALVVTRNLPPLIGGMENLVWRLVDGLAAVYETRVVGPKGSAASKPDGSRVAEVPHRPIGVFLVSAFLAAIRSVVGWRPQLVVAGSGLTAPVAWLIGRATRARVVVYVHGLDIESRSRIYQALWLPFIRNADTVITNSQFSAGLARMRGVPDSKLAIVHPGTRFPAMGEAETSRRVFRQRHGLGENKLMLYVGRITERKGLIPFIENVLPAVLAKCPDTELVVLGDMPSESLIGGGDGLRSRMNVALQDEALASRVHLLGFCRANDPTISEAYFAADVHVFPVQERPGDNEGFGMVALEAAAHGTPTVAYRAGGVADAVAHAQSGYLVDAGDEAGFAARIVDVLNGAGGELKPRTFAEAFDWDRFGREIREAVVGKDRADDDGDRGRVEDG